MFKFQLIFISFKNTAKTRQNILFFEESEENDNSKVYKVSLDFCN